MGKNLGYLVGAGVYLASLALFFSQTLSGDEARALLSLAVLGGSILFWGYALGVRGRGFLEVWPLVLLPVSASSVFLLLSTGFARLLVFGLTEGTSGEEEYLIGITMVLTSLILANFTGRLMLLWNERRRASLPPGKLHRVLQGWGEAVLLLAPTLLPLLTVYLYPFLAPPRFQYMKE